MHDDTLKEKTGRIKRLKENLLDPNSSLPESTIEDEITALTEISYDLRGNFDISKEERERRITLMAHRILEKEYREYYPKGKYNPKEGEQGLFYGVLAERGLVPFPPKEPLMKKVARDAKDYVHAVRAGFKAAVKESVKEFGRAISGKK